MCLNKLYNNLNLTGEVDYSEVKILKDRIDKLKTEILDGVRIRSRVEEQLHNSRTSVEQQNNKDVRFHTFL